MALLSALPVMVVNRTGRAEAEGSVSSEVPTCLDWTPGPSGCPTAEQTEAAVADMVGHSVFGATPCPINVRGRMRRLEKNGWEANLSFSTSTGEALGDRTLRSESASCASLKDPVSLVIALMIEAHTPQATLHIPSQEEPPQARRSSLSASFVLSSGFLPKLAYGGSIAWMMEALPWLSWQMGGTFFFPQSSVHQERGGEFWGALAGADLCPQVLSHARIEGAVCLGGRAGVIHGVGVGLPYTGSPTKPYGDAELLARISFPLLGSLAAFAQVGLAVPWMRPRFVYFDAAQESVGVHRPQAVLFFASAGFEQRSGEPTPRGGASP